MHVIHTRPPTEAERRIIKGQAGLDVASYGCLILLLGIIPMALLALLGGWLGGLIWADGTATGCWVGAALGAAILVCALTTFIPYERRQRQRAAMDSQSQVVEAITVSDARWIEIGLVSDNEPIVAFDIGEGKILFLQGQWLRDPATYDAPVPREDGPEGVLNGLPTPHSFPSTSFAVTRLPHSGRVLGIRVHGAYLAREREVEALRPEYEFGDSEVFDGDLEQIADVLSRAHNARFHGGEPPEL